MTGAGDAQSCTYVSGEQVLVVEVLRVGFDDAYQSLLDTWSRAPAITDDGGAFIVDGERAAMLVDAGGRSLLLMSTDANADARDQFDRLESLAAAARTS